MNLNITKYFDFKGLIFKDLFLLKQILYNCFKFNVVFHIVFALEMQFTFKAPYIKKTAS